MFSGISGIPKNELSLKYYPVQPACVLRRRRASQCTRDTSRCGHQGLCFSFFYVRKDLKPSSYRACILTILSRLMEPMHRSLVCTYSTRANAGQRYTNRACSPLSGYQSYLPGDRPECLREQHVVFDVGLGQTAIRVP